MHWVDKIAKRIIDSGKYIPYHVDDMFTPSGYAHVGSLRGPLVHDLVYRALISAGQNASFTFVFNDFDPLDGLPPDLTEQFNPYLGLPLRKVPSPVEGYDSFAEYFSQDMEKVLKNLGVEPEFLSSWDMYQEGKFDAVIKLALDNSEQVQEIYSRVSKSKKKEQGWLPLQVICEKCGKIGTTRVHGWDGSTVAYTCEPEMVVWARGCGYTGRISPFGGRGKLPWKVDWPAHWMVIGVTIEGEGKDHSSSGGSRDISREITQDIFNYPEPYDLPYEFFLFGGKKMASSKGIGIKGRDLTTLLPPSVAKFLFARTDFREAIEFNPQATMAIPNLFDEYDRAWQAYIDGSDENLSRAFELSQVEPVPKDEVFRPRFRDVANYLQQPSIDLRAKFTEIKGSSLTDNELNLLQNRENYARIWMAEYSPEEYQLQMSDSVPEEASSLSEKQRSYLGEVITLLGKVDGAEELQQQLYDKSKEMGIATKDAFSAIYKAFIGKAHGPKAGWFLLQYPREKVIERLKEVSGK